MATKTVEINEFESRLAELVAQAAAGTEIVFTEGDTPRARLIAVGLRVPGLHPASMEAAADFDAPLPDGFWIGTA